MESANLQNQLQELFVGYSSLISAPKPAPITHQSSPNIILDGNSYNRPYNLMDQSLQCSRENENQWFNFSSNYQPNYEQQLISTTLFSSMQSPSSYGSFQGISNTNHYYSNNVFSSSTRNSNASTLDLLSSSSLSSSMDNNLQADYNPSGFNKNKSALFSYAHQLHDHVQDSIDDHNNTPSNISNKISSTSITRAKRPVSSLSIPKKSNNINIIPQSKKPCSTSTTSCPPLKVRKEKLGDRISALQRLVAPFGKTDTSSVLSEAIGYIQFLHDQVETLSMPYLGSSQNKPYHKLQPGLHQKDETKQRQDLRSRGLCLMPLPYASFINGYD